MLGTPPAACHLTNRIVQAQERPRIDRRLGDVGPGFFEPGVESSSRTSSSPISGRAVAILGDDQLGDSRLNLFASYCSGRLQGKKPRGRHLVRSSARKLAEVRHSRGAGSFRDSPRRGWSCERASHRHVDLPRPRRLEPTADLSPNLCFPGRAISRLFAVDQTEM